MTQHSPPRVVAQYNTGDCKSKTGKQVNWLVLLDSKLGAKRFCSFTQKYDILKSHFPELDDGFRAGAHVEFVV